MGSSGTKIRPKKILCWSLLVLTALIMALPYLPWLAGGLIPKAQALSLWLLLIPAATLLVALLRRKALPSILFGAVVLLGMLPQLQLQLPVAPGPGVAGTAPLSVLSFNAYKAEANATQLAQAISDSAPDVLVLVETSEPLHQVLSEQGVMEEYRYRTAQAPAGGVRDTVVFSRLPLKEVPSTLSADATSWLLMPTVEITVHGQQVLLAGIHVFPPLGNAQKWGQGLEAVGDWVQANQGHPIILAGDFNATRGNQKYRQSVAGLNESGALPAATWPVATRFMPLVEIDHIVSRGFKVTATQRLHIDGSDHLALSATMHLQPAPSQ